MSSAIYIARGAKHISLCSYRLNKCHLELRRLLQRDWIGRDYAGYLSFVLIMITWDLQGKHQEAAALYKDTLAIIEKHGGAEQALYARTLGNFGEVLKALVSSNKLYPFAICV